MKYSPKYCIPIPFKSIWMLLMWSHNMICNSHMILLINRMMIWYALMSVSLVKAPRSILRGCSIMWKTLVTVLHFERTCEKLKKGKSWNFAAVIGWPIEGDSKHEMSILSSWGGWLAESVVEGGVTRSRGVTGGLTFAWESDTSGGICKAVCNERKNLSGVSGFSEFCEGSREVGW